MAGRDRGVPSPVTTARVNRQRLAAAQGKNVMAEAERKAAAVRENMARLRALREANESGKGEPAIDAVAPAKKLRP